MWNTNRARAVLAELPANCEEHPLADLRDLVGKKVTVVSVELSAEHCDRLTGVLLLRDEKGENHTLELGTFLEVQDYGVCGYSLEEYFDTDTLCEALEKAIRNEGNGLSVEDRVSLRNDLHQLNGDLEDEGEDEDEDEDE
jgi:hypothetical protein